ncbi:hypothetical protein [Flavobacterium sp.]|uniref:hypothetical protein n=1 Tax=Flavobacterium sp. TaxID=239 RepID=UPI0039E4FC1C
MKKLIFVFALVIVSCGREKKEVSAPVNDKFSIVLEAVYQLDDSLSVVIKKDGYWDYENPISLSVKGQDLAQKITVDLPEQVYLENFQVTLSTNKEQKHLDLKGVTVLNNEKVMLEGSALKYVPYFNANSGMKWDEKMMRNDLNFNGEYPPGFVGNEQLESVLMN